jgi:hypothetical protein
MGFHVLEFIVCDVRDFYYQYQMISCHCTIFNILTLGFLENTWTWNEVQYSTKVLSETDVHIVYNYLISNL